MNRRLYTALELYRHRFPNGHLVLPEHDQLNGRGLVDQQHAYLYQGLGALVCSMTENENNRRRYFDSIALHLVRTHQKISINGPSNPIRTFVTQKLASLSLQLGAELIVLRTGDDGRVQSAAFGRGEVQQEVSPDSSHIFISDSDSLPNMFRAVRPLLLPPPDLYTAATTTTGASLPSGPANQFSSISRRPAVGSADLTTIQEHSPQLLQRDAAAFNDSHYLRENRRVAWTTILNNALISIMAVAIVFALWYCISTVASAATAVSSGVGWFAGSVASVAGGVATFFGIGAAGHGARPAGAEMATRMHKTPTATEHEAPARWLARYRSGMLQVDSKRVHPGVTVVRDMFRHNAQALEEIDMQMIFGIMSEDLGVIGQGWLELAGKTETAVGGLSGTALSLEKTFGASYEATKDQFNRLANAQEQLDWWHTEISRTSNWCHWPGLCGFFGVTWSQAKLATWADDLWNITTSFRSLLSDAEGNATMVRFNLKQSIQGYPTRQKLVWSKALP